MLIKSIQRELLLSMRRPADLLNPLVFFVLVVSLFPLGISPSDEVLKEIAPGVIWVAALLSTLLSMEVMFRNDFEDGSLEQMSISPQPFLVLVGGKIVGQWLVSGLPLVLMSPVLAVMLALSEEGIKAMFISLLLGTPILSLLGSIGAGLTIGLKKGGALIAILILPLYIPVLILGTHMIIAAEQGVSYSGDVLWLAAILALSISLAPFATTESVRIALSDG
ncbi:MAG: heme exporter protein CcmB [Pseudomonadales bacterium]|nr:heme exporter protein CcmB [Pseudomonadales bacterium]